MKMHLILLILVSTLGSAFQASGATAGGPAYDLTGQWRFTGLDQQLSFCDGTSSQEVVNGVARIVQSGDSLSMTFLDPPNNQTLQGRTSFFFVGAEMSTPEQSTILTGTVAADANRINGTIVFVDKNVCPDAETGSARFVLMRIG